MKVSAESEERVERGQKREDDDRVDFRRRISDSFVCATKPTQGNYHDKPIGRKKKGINWK